MNNQNISAEKSEPLDSHPMSEKKRLLEFPLRNQSHWTHMLCWNMQRLFAWSEHPFQEIRAGLTFCVGICKNYLSDHNIPSEKSKPVNLHTILEYAKIVWVIRTSLWEIRATGLTCYIGMCKNCLSDQNISFEKSGLTTYIWNMQRLFEWSEHPFEK